MTESLFIKFCKFVDESIFPKENRGESVAFIVDLAFIDDFCKKHSVSEDARLKDVKINLNRTSKDNHLHVSGFLWYQGETNVGRHDTYAARLQTLAAHWGGLWGQGELPFYLVELAPYRYGASNDGNRKGGISGALLREAQFEAARSIPNSGIVCTNDLAYPYEDIQIHPCRKKEVGQRLAWLALNRTYGFGSIDCEGPVFREMEIIGNEAVLRFDNDRNGFSPWHDIEGFEIAGEDRIFHKAEAYVVPGQKCVKVSSEAVDRPVAVRYCFRDFCPGNLTGSRNLPAFPFRTDDWQ